LTSCCLMFLVCWINIYHIRDFLIAFLSCRCHYNDLENIIPFFFIGLLYALSGPELSSALLHFRIFTAARIFHSFAYILVLPQPSRAISYFLGMLVTFSMAYSLLSKVFFL
ncbi:Microsomal glutathione S-transferase 1, partial [Xenoophorus captivus]